MPRIFIPKADLSAGSMEVTGEDHRHLAFSLRMKPGEDVTVCDGNGNDIRCKIASVASDRTVLIPLEEKPCENEPPFPLTLFQALPKGEKTDWIIQKSVEFGVCEIGFFQGERSVARLAVGEIAKKRDRWQKIADGAARQCGRGILPQISVLSFRDALAKAAEGPAFFCHCGGEALPLPSFLKRLSSPSRLSFFVGPEGGFSDGEVYAARSAGLPLVSLGNRILRCESASLFTLACIAYEFE